MKGDLILVSFINILRIWGCKENMTTKTFVSFFSTDETVTAVKAILNNFQSFFFSEDQLNGLDLKTTISRM